MDLKLKENEVVLCNTKEEAEKCCELAATSNKKWNNNILFNDDNYWEDDINYIFYDFNLGFCYNYPQKNNNIITAREFIERYNKNKIKWIRGNKEHGKEVYNILLKNGAKEDNSFSCTYEDLIYYINEKNMIYTAYFDSVIGSLIMNNGKELKLSKKQEYIPKMFEYVLGRNYINDSWEMYQFIRIANNTKFKYVMINGEFIQYILPYQGNENLLGTI